MSRRLARLERMHISDDERKRYHRRRGSSRLFRSSLDAGIARQLQARSSDGSADTETARDYAENVACRGEDSGEDMEVTRKLSSLNVGLDGARRRLGVVRSEFSDYASLGVLSESEAISGCVSWRTVRKKRRRCRNIKAVGGRKLQKRKLPVSDRSVTDGTARKWKRMSSTVNSRFDSSGLYVQDDPDFSVSERCNPDKNLLKHSISTSSTVTYLSPDTETSSSGTFPRLTEEAIASFACRFQVNMTATSSIKCPKKSTSLRRLCRDQTNSSGDDSVFVNPPSPQPELSISSSGTSCALSNLVLLENDSIMVTSPEDNEMSDASVDQGSSSSSSSLSDPGQTADERGRDGDDEESSFEHSARVIPWWDKETNTSEDEEDMEIRHVMDGVRSKSLYFCSCVSVCHLSLSSLICSDILQTRPHLSSTSCIPQTRHVRTTDLQFFSIE